MKNYQVELSENGWEYIGYISINADDVKQIDENKLTANGALIEFDEEIRLVN